MRFKSWLLPLGLALLISQAGCRSAQLVNPGPIKVSCQSEEQMRKGIIDSLKKRKWALAKEEEGRILATLYIRSHQADIAIDYDKEQFTIRYVDSKNLDHHRSLFGKEMIHKNYNGWIRYLVQDITVAASYAE